MNSIIINIKGIEDVGFQGLSFKPEIITQKLSEFFDDLEILEVDIYSKRIVWAREQFKVTDRRYSDKFLDNIISECKSYLPAKSFRIPIGNDEYLEGTVWSMSLNFQSKNIEIPEHLIVKIREFAKNFSVELIEL